MKRFGILGSGQVGQVMAEGLKSHGFEVRIGSRSPEKLKAFARDRGITAGSFAETAAWAEAIVLAVKGLGAEEALRLAGREHLEGKLVIDTTNPIADDPPEDGVLRYFTGPNESLMERLQKAAPQARLVKAFSCIGSGFMVDPKFPGGKPTMFICGDEITSKKEAAAICEEFGFEVEDMGTAKAARAIEPLAMLWCIPGLRENRWSHAFKLLRA